MISHCASTPSKNSCNSYNFNSNTLHHHLHHYLLHILLLLPATTSNSMSCASTAQTLWDGSLRSPSSSITRQLPKKTGLPLRHSTLTAPHSVGSNGCIEMDSLQPSKLYFMQSKLDSLPPFTMILATLYSNSSNVVQSQNI